MKARVEIQPIPVDLEGEDDGRILASVPALPGVMAYGATDDEAIRKVKSIALQVLADMIESGEASELRYVNAARCRGESEGGQR